MRRRRLIVLLVALFAVIGAGTFAVAASTKVYGTAAGTANTYFTSWRNGDIEAMRRLVDQPPRNFVTTHLALDDGLHVESFTLTPGALRVTGDQRAEVPFSGVRKLKEFGDLPFAGTLRLAVRDRAWRVLWAPETLDPHLKGGGQLEVKVIEGPATRLVTREGAEIPNNGYLDAYLDRLLPEFDDGVSEGWALEATAPGKPAERLQVILPDARKVRTTLSRSVQAAAARALDAVDDAAIVVLRPSSGEVLAVADRLKEASAFHSLFPPGSTFKVITASALLAAGLDPVTEVGCPPSYTIPEGRTFTNAGGGSAADTTTFLQAFAISCNTAFAEQATTRLTPADLLEAAKAWGINGDPLPTGVSGNCGEMPEPDDLDRLGEDAIGQGLVQVTPLCMAMVAAAVENGTWRSPRILVSRGQIDDIDGGPPPRPVELDDAVVAALRSMMRAVVTDGTAAGAGLPDGVAGKTGTAEVGGGEHGWFIGYRGDLAFCVFVRYGGAGRQAAVPVAARFLNGL